MGIFTQFKTYIVALLVAISGTLLLTQMGVVDPHQSIYLPTNFPWLGFIVGGLIFGIGMVFAGGCATRILVRVGEGNLGALIAVLGFNITAGSALGGHLAYANEYLFRKFTISLPSSSIPELLGINPWILVGVLAVGAAAWIIMTKKSDEFLSSSWPLVSLAVGLLVVAGWYVTGTANSKIMADEFLAMDANVVSSFRPASLTFAKPNADFFMYTATATGSSVDFGIATVLGVVLGSLLAALLSKSFHWVAPTGSQSFLGYLIGGLLMGFGAIIALGCNIGQGLTGMSVLGLGALITIIFILLGSWVGIWLQEKLS